VVVYKALSNVTLPGMRELARSLSLSLFLSLYLPKRNGGYFGLLYILLIVFRTDLGEIRCEDVYYIQLIQEGSNPSRELGFRV
jgi:hypothetical protein